MKTILLFLLMLTSLRAASITHTATVFPAFTDWSLTNSVPQFDPSLGTLTNVTIEIDVNAANVIKVESRSNLARTVTGGGIVTAVATAAGYSASTTLTNSHTQAMARFDGVIDYGGTSGFTVNVSGSSGAAATPADFTPFIGTGNIPLIASAVANGFFRGPADYAFEIATQASALVVVTYDFTPNCPLCEDEDDCKPRVKPPTKDDDCNDDDRRKSSRRTRR